MNVVCHTPRFSNIKKKCPEAGLILQNRCLKNRNYEAEEIDFRPLWLKSRLAHAN